MTYEVEKDWMTQAGLRAVVIICKSGKRKTHRCGYVGLPPEHPLHGIDYNTPADCISQASVDSATIGKKSPILAFIASVNADEGQDVRRSPDIAFDVHGGLTYSGGKNYPVASDLWWFGFDCRHAGDGEIEPDTRYPGFYEGPVRELDYVEAECESLAKQLTAVA